MSNGAETKEIFATTEGEFHIKIAQRAYVHCYAINISGKFHFPAFDENGRREKLSTPSPYWSSSSGHLSEHGLTIERFTTQPGCRPSLALRDLLERGGIIECGIFISLVNQCIKLDMLGDTLFDFVNEQEPFVLPSTKTLFLQKFPHSIIPDDLGRFGYIPNVPDFPDMDPEGFFAGENVFCVGKNDLDGPEFMGYGPFFVQKKTEQEIKEQLYQATIAINEEGNDDEVDKYRDREFWENEQFAYQMEFPVYGYSYAEFMQTTEMLNLFNHRG